MWLQGCYTPLGDYNLIAEVDMNTSQITSTHNNESAVREVKFIIFLFNKDLLSKDFLKIWTTLKVFNELVTALLLLFMFWYFDQEACGILVPWPGIEPAPPALEREILTTGLPWKSQEE